MSSFHGLEMAKQALFAQQSALYTTGHNISNANTEGYSRQRINFESLSPYPSASRNRPEIPGQMGTGVMTGSVERVRNKFLDYQFRAENSKAGYWETTSESFDRLEGLMNEPSESGLSKTMDQFWQSLQDLSVNPENSGARSVVVQRGLAVAETFNYLSDSLRSIRSDLQEQIDATEKNANSILRQINNLNKEIKTIEPHGYLANDLYDERDRLIDALSEIVNIKVSHDKSADGALAIADGVVTIEVVDSRGVSFEEPIILVDGKSDGFNELSVDYGAGDYQGVSSITVGEETLEVMSTNGSLKGLIESYGYRNGTDVDGVYPKMLEDIDKMASVFAEEFNRVHRDGQDLEGNMGQDFFDFTGGSGAASSISIAEAILNKPSLLAVGAENKGSRNGENALALADVFGDTSIVGLDGDTSVNGFLQSIIADLGIQAQEAKRMTANTGILRSQVEEQRMSVSAVSLDEEMSNMIKFQHAYNAAARSMTTIDEMLDRVINGMGLVGR